MKKVLSVLLALCLLVGSVPMAAYAANMPGYNEVSTLEGFLNRMVSAYMYDYDYEKLSYEAAPGGGNYGKPIYMGIFSILQGFHLETYGMKLEYDKKLQKQKIPLTDVEWLCKNILNWSDASWDDLIACAKSNKGYLSSGKQMVLNGSYVCADGPAGNQFGEGIKTIKQQTINGRQEILFAWMYKGFETTVQQRGTFFAQVEKKSIGGKEYWTLYRLKKVEEGDDPFTKRPTVGSFSDVYEDDYYADSVLWADGSGITSGIGGGKFGPKRSCTRDQIVTFLYRSKGSPAVTVTSDFTDMPKSEEFRRAISWAVENGITVGDGKGKFLPQNSCTRVQAVTFIWRAAGKQEPKSIASFKDMPSGSDFQKAISWAYENGITKGVGDGTKFGPDQTCTRGQIVTFLYNARNL